jgi:hypothetical protein
VLAQVRYKKDKEKDALTVEGGPKEDDKKKREHLLIYFPLRVQGFPVQVLIKAYSRVLS